MPNRTQFKNKPKLFSLRYHFHENLRNITAKRAKPNGFIQLQVTSCRLQGWKTDNRFLVIGEL